MYIGEGNGNPLQYSCLENPIDRGAWQAIVHGVARVGHDLATKPPQIYIYIYVYIHTHTRITESLAGLLKLTQHCKSTIFQFKRGVCKKRGKQPVIVVRAERVQTGDQRATGEL